MKRRLGLAIFGLLVLYTGLQAIRLDPGRPLSAWTATVAFFLVAIGSQAARLSSRRPKSAWLKPAAWTGAFALGVWASFVLIMLPLELFPAEPGRGRALAALAAAAFCAGLGLRQALAGPVVREVIVPVTGLPESLRGLRIVQLSDLHVGPTIDRAYVESVVRRTLELAPDLVAVTGDLADGSVEELAEHVEPLRGLRAPLGVYFATGNHEYYWGVEPWLAKIRSLGVEPLVDEGRVVEARGQRLLVAGVADAAAAAFAPGHRSDARQAAAAGAACAFKLLLAHRPASCVEAEAAGFDLQLSGHTHGGQFFPFRLVAALANRYTRGLHRHGRLWVYVSCGTGYWGPPNRFTVPSEITLLRLETA